MNHRDQEVTKWILDLKLCVTSINEETADQTECTTEGYTLPFSSIEKYLIYRRVTPVYRRTLTLEIEPDFLIMINGNSFEVVCGSTIVPSYTIYLSKKRVPIALINPFKTIMLTSNGHLDAVAEFLHRVQSATNEYSLTYTCE